MRRKVKTERSSAHQNWGFLKANAHLLARRISLNSYFFIVIHLSILLNLLYVWLDFERVRLFFIAFPSGIYERYLYYFILFLAFRLVYMWLKKDLISVGGTLFIGLLVFTLEFALALISQFVYLRWIVVSSIGGAALLLVILAFRHFRLYVMTGKKSRPQYFSIITARIVILTCAIMLITFVWGFSHLQDSVAQSRRAFAERVESPEEMREYIAANEAVFANLSSAVFIELSSVEQVSTLEQVIAMECDRFGIATIELSVEEGLSFDVKYDSQKRRIVVERTLLQQPDVLIKAVIRECFYAYREDCVDLLEAAGITDEKLLTFKNMLLGGAICTADLHYLQSEKHYNSSSIFNSGIEETVESYCAMRMSYYFRNIINYTPSREAIITEVNRTASERDLRLPDRIYCEIVDGKLEFSCRFSNRATTGHILLFGQGCMQRIDLVYYEEDDILRAVIDEPKSGNYDAALFSGEIDSREDYYGIKIGQTPLIITERKIFERTNRADFEHNSSFDSNRRTCMINLGYVQYEIRNHSEAVVDGLTSSLEKARALHDWIAENIEYNHDCDIIRRAYMDDPLLALKYRKSVCSGIARLYHEMLRSVGIPSRVVSGYAKDQSEVDELELATKKRRTNHAWNQVYIEELQRWINVDVTYDLNRVQADYQYFAFSEETLARTRLIIEFDEEYDCVFREVSE